MRITLKGKWAIFKDPHYGLLAIHTCLEETPQPVPNRPPKVLRASQVQKIILGDKTFYQCSGCMRRMPADALREAQKLGASFRTERI